MAKPGYVYILASRRNGTLYIGVTGDLIRRIQQHREGQVEGFTKKHEIRILVHFEAFPDVKDAIQRETQLKRWRRAWKVELIESRNPYWRDLYGDLWPAVKNDAGFPLPRE